MNQDPKNNKESSPWDELYKRLEQNEEQSTDQTTDLNQANNSTDSSQTSNSDNFNYNINPDNQVNNANQPYSPYNQAGNANQPNNPYNQASNANQPNNPFNQASNANQPNNPFNQPYQANQNYPYGNNPYYHQQPNMLYQQKMYQLKKKENRITQIKANINYQAKSRASFLLSICIYFVMFYLAIYFAQKFLVYLYEVIYSTPLNLDGEISSSAIYWLTTWLQLAIYLPTTIAVVAILWKVIVEDFIGFKRNVKPAVLAVLKGYGLIYVFNLGFYLVQTFLGVKQSSGNQAAIVDMLTGPYAIVIIVVTVILAPILEELIFRKSLFGVLQPRFSSPVPVIIISGVLFGGIHVFSTTIELIISNGTFDQIATELFLGIPYIAMGIIFGYIYDSSNRNIWPVILLHTLNNLFGVIVTLLF